MVALNRERWQQCKDLLNWNNYALSLYNRPGLAGVVLQTPLSFIHKVDAKLNIETLYPRASCLALATVSRSFDFSSSLRRFSSMSIRTSLNTLKILRVFFFYFFSHQQSFSQISNHLHLGINCKLFTCVIYVTQQQEPGWTWYIGHPIKFIMRKTILDYFWLFALFWTILIHFRPNKSLFYWKKVIC